MNSLKGLAGGVSANEVCKYSIDCYFGWKLTLRYYVSDVKPRLDLFTRSSEMLKTL